MTLGTLLRRAMVGVSLFAAGAFAQDRTILMGAVVKPDGRIAPGMAVVVAGGKIERVVPAGEVNPTSKDVVVKFEEFQGAVISPGLIDLRSAAGALGQTYERTRPVDPSLTAIDAVNLNDAFFERALQAGITSVMITPSEVNVVGGVAATIRTRASGQHRASADVLRADGPMTFNLGTGVLDPNRGPSSRAGALTLLRQSLSDAKAGKGAERLANVVNKKLDSLVLCESAEDVDAAARTFGEYGLKPNLVLGDGAIEAAGELGGSNITAVIGPLTFRSGQKSLLGPAKLAKAGVDVAFAGRTPLVEPVGLRVTASLAVRYGMDPAAARLGLTRNAARVAGVADRVGTLEAGKEADIVVFSADPLRLDAKVLEVYVKGTLAHSRPVAHTDEGWESDHTRAGDSRNENEN